MNGLTKFFIATALTVSVTGTSIGYAQLSDTLNVIGTVDVTPPDGVFIYEVNEPSDGKITVNNYSGTVLNSTTNLGADGKSVATVEISVYNNSGYVYVFNTVKYLEGAETYDNQNIHYDLVGLSKGQEIEGEGTITFTLEFYYLNPEEITNTILNSVLNFEFVPHADYVPEIAVDGAAAQFEQILNTDTSFNKLITQMESTSWDRLSNTYIGNVVGATSTDSAVLNELFTVDGKNYLTLNINGEETNVTALIKSENLDGNASTGDESGNEMTIYMTADDLTTMRYGSNATVYACVFTKVGDGEWYQIGQMYEGTATVCSYVGFWGHDSFNTDNWKTAVAYYGIAAGATIETVVAAIPEEER
ncbi:MAG: hypothetical protein IJ506_04715 [Clostridia bacterium]|nr:hypothetical protein [Clostridia bacterium]